MHSQTVKPFKYHLNPSISSQFNMRPTHQVSYVQHCALCLSRGTVDNPLNTTLADPQDTVPQTRGVAPQEQERIAVPTALCPLSIDQKAVGYVHRLQQSTVLRKQISVLIGKTIPTEFVAYVKTGAKNVCRRWLSGSSTWTCSSTPLPTLPAGYLHLFLLLPTGYLPGLRSEWYLHCSSCMLTEGPFKKCTEFIINWGNRSI